MRLAGTQKICAALFVYVALRLFGWAPLSSDSVLFLYGLTLILGMGKTSFLAQKQKTRGTLCFLGGTLLVFFTWRLVVPIVRILGFLNLFGVIISANLAFLRGLPVIETFLTLPYVREVTAAFEASFSI